MRVRVALSVAALMFCAPALAEDVPRWGGFYVGVHAGYAQDAAGPSPLSADADFTPILFSGAPNVNPPVGPLAPTSLKSDLRGPIAGAQFGYNLQHGGVVLGIEADLAHVSGDGNASETKPQSENALDFPPTTTSLETKLDWLATVRGRIGFLPSPRLLVYATGGVAFGDVEQKLAFQAAEPLFFVATDTPRASLNCGLGVSDCLAGSSSRTSVGWTGGGGVEFALSDTVSLKAEYLYVDLGREVVKAVGTDLVLTTPGVFLAAETEIQLHTVRGGLNVHF